MLKKSFVLPPIIAALLQVAYRAYWIQFMNAVSKPLLHFTDYMVFTGELESILLLLSLLILFGVIFLAPSPASNQKSSGNEFWYFGFMGILLFTGASIVYANPQGRFPWNKHDNYIELEVRSRKPDLYKKLERTPDLVLFGSSVSFLVPMDYFEEKWGIQAFNMSVNGGGPADFINLLDTIKRTSPDSKMPAVVMVEILNPGLSVNNLEQTPVSQIPDMASAQQQAGVLWTTFKSALRFNSFSDSLFTLYFVDQGRWDIVAALTDNGSMIQSEENVKDKQYQKSVEKNIVLLDELQSCESLDKDGKIAFERLVQLSHQYKFSLAIYRTPINQDFYALSHFEPSKYSKCSQLFNEYVESIAAQNSNVFFKDLSQYKEISTGGKELYRDTHHLTAKGNILLLEALNDEIKSALQWARENR